MDSNYHIIPLEELKQKLKTDFERGITTEQAQESSQLFGKNLDQKEDSNSYLLLFFQHQLNFQSFVLWVCALLSLYNYTLLSDEISDLYCGLVIMIGIFITSAISVNVARNKENNLQLLAKRTESQYNVIRDNNTVKIFKSEIVVGDILFIEEGQEIPADARLLQVDQMRVDHSFLTGETEAIERSAVESDQNMLESKNVLFKGTTCILGNGKCVVFAVGNGTVISKIAVLMVYDEPKGQEKQILKIIKLIILSGIILSSLLMLQLFIFSQFSLSLTLNAIVGLLIGFIPFTLSSKYQVLLDQSLLNLLKQNIILRNQNALSQAQNVTCILADKTGTITLNKLAVSHLYYGNSLYKTPENNFDKGVEFNTEDSEFLNLFKIGALSCNAVFILPQGQSNVDYSTCKMLGNVSDQALLRFLQNIKNIEQFKQNFKFAKNVNGESAKLSFTSRNKYQLNIVEEETENSHYTVYIKGAAEQILELSKFYTQNGSEIEIEDNFKEEIQEILEKLSKLSERVLSFAKLRLPSEQFPKGYTFQSFDSSGLPFQVQNLIFEGLISFKDQIKPEAEYAVEVAKKMAIRTILITGDMQQSAEYTAQAVGILSQQEESTFELMKEDDNLSLQDAINRTENVIIGGNQLQTIDSKYYINKPNLVLYRITPAQKIDLVKSLQANKETVLAIGDGTNDAPALKASDVSISMFSGTQVAQGASDAISLDDKVDSSINLILESRFFMQNLTKAIANSLSLVYVEIFCIFAFAIFQIPLPLSSFSILLIQLLIDVIPSFISLNPKTQNRKMDKIYQSIQPLSIKTYVSSLLSLKVIASLILGFCSYIYTFQYFGFNSVLGFAKIQGYQPSNLQGKILVGQDAFYNQNLEQIAQNCLENQDKTDKIKIQIDWFSQAQRNYDLRSVLLKCDSQTKKWVPSVNWGACNSQISGCYSTQAYYWAQIAFFSSVTIVFLTSNLLF